MFYKVVREIEDGTLKSLVDHDGALEYSVSDWTYPNIGKLFVFKDMREAENYAEVSSVASTVKWIFEVITKNPVEIEEIVRIGLLWNRVDQEGVSYYLKKFWEKDGFPDSLLFHAPKSTFVCDGLLLKNPVMRFTSHSILTPSDEDLRRIKWPTHIRS